MYNDYVITVNPAGAINMIDAKSRVTMQIKMLIRHSKTDMDIDFYGTTADPKSPFISIRCTEAAKNMLEQKLTGIETIYKKPPTQNPALKP